MECICRFFMKGLVVLLLVMLNWTHQLKAQDASYLLWTPDRVTNHSPHITSQPPHMVNKTYVYDIDAVDEDGDLLRFSLSGAPEGMVLDPVTGMLTWTASQEQIGTHTPLVTVSDTRGGTDTQAIPLEVTEEVFSLMTAYLLEGINLQDGSAERDATVLALGVGTDLSTITDIVLPNMPDLFAFRPAVTFHLEYQTSVPVIAPESTVAQLAIEDTAEGGSTYEEIQAADIGTLTWQTPAKIAAGATKTIIFQRTDGRCYKIGHLTSDASRGEVTFSYDELVL